MKKDTVARTDNDLLDDVMQHAQSAALGSAPARPLCLPRARLAALDSHCLGCSS